MVFKTIGIFAAILTSTGFIPQIIKALKIRELKDVSILMLFIIFTGTFLWTIYGISIGDPIVTSANVLTCSTAGILIVMKKIYNGNGAGKDE